MSERRGREGTDVREGGLAAGQAPAADRGPRPMIERVGLGAIALVLVVAFGAVAVAAFAGGEVFLGVMAGAGALMTLWAAAVSVLRG